MSTPTAMTALKGPVRRWRGFDVELLDVGEVAVAGVAGREEVSRFVIPPRRSVA